MSITSFLNQCPESQIYFRDRSLTYRDLSSLITGSKSSPLFHWNGEWTSSNFVSLLNAIESKTPVICSVNPQSGHLALASGEIAFRSSGTEGEPKWVIHDSSVFTTGKILKFTGPVKAFLSPAHAAGFDFMFHALRQGTAFSFARLEDAEKDFLPVTIFGPPQALAFLLFFFQKNEKLLTGLREFFSSTDSLSVQVVDRCRKHGLSFRLRNFYGSTETMMIWNESHPDNPCLIKIDSTEGFLRDGCFYYTGKTLARRIEKESVSHVLKTPYPIGDFMEEDGGWISLIKNNRSLIKVWGQTINLKELENILMSDPRVAFAKIEAKSDAMNTQLQLTLYGAIDETKSLEALLPDSLGKAKLQFTIRPASEIDLAKTKRIKK